MRSHPSTMNMQPSTPQNILVFKTSIKTKADMLKISSVLDADRDIDQWSVDLDDCDKVLRVVSCTLSPLNIIELVNQKGYLCIELT